jgi:hypothetical protein
VVDRGKQRRIAALPVALNWTPRPPKAPTTAGVPVAAISTVDTSSSNFVPLLLAIGLALSLLILALAATPAGFLPRHVGLVVYERRDSIVVGAAATALSITLGLLIALLGS